MVKFLSYFLRVLSPGVMLKRGAAKEEKERKNKLGQWNSIKHQIPFESLDEEAKSLLHTLDNIRAINARGDQMLLLEGNYYNQRVFVRDIRLEGETSENVMETLYLAQHLRHVNINRVVFARFHKNRIILVAEHAVESVQQKIYKSRSICFEETLTQQDALKIAISVCNAAKHMHKRGFINLGLRPASILAFRDGSYRLSESCISPIFGGVPINCATSVGENGNENVSMSQVKCSMRSIETVNSKTFPLRKGETSTGFVNGVEYMAPEVLDGQVGTSKSDVFSFGMLLWQLFHLRRIYSNDCGMMQIYQSLKSGIRPTIDPSVITMESPLRKIINLCWSSEADHRPTFEEISGMLLVAHQIISPEEQSNIQVSKNAVSDLMDACHRTRSTQAEFVDVEEDFFDTAGGDDEVKSLPPSPYADIDTSKLSYPSPIARTDLKDIEQVQSKNSWGKRLKTRKSITPTRGATKTGLSLLPLGERVVAWNPSSREYFTGTVEDYGLDQGQPCRVAVSVEASREPAMLLWLPTTSVTSLYPTSSGSYCSSSEDSTCSSKHARASLASAA